MTEQWIPANKAELMSAIEREWSALWEVIRKLSAKQMLRPDVGGWTPKDNLAHLTEWMKILLGYHMDKRPSHEVMGMAPEVTANWDFDVINQLLLERNRGRTLDDVLNELEVVYAQVLERLNATPFEDLLKPRRSDDPNSLLLYSVIGDTYEHFAEHRETIEWALKA